MICLPRDLRSMSGKQVKPARTFTHHHQVVNDVQYHPVAKHFIGTVSDDLTLQILDTRQADSNRSALVVKGGHNDALNALAFNPGSEYLIATASADKTIGIWDMRNAKEKVHTLEGHNDAVTSLSWHPHEVGVLGSGSYDRRVVFWDLTRIGEEQTPEDSEDGPPELYVWISHAACLSYLPVLTQNLVSLCMAATPTTWLISAGTLMTPGWLPAPLKTMSCRSGNLPSLLSVAPTIPIYPWTSWIVRHVHRRQITLLL